MSATTTSKTNDRCMLTRSARDPRLLRPLSLGVTHSIGWWLPTQMTCPSAPGGMMAAGKGLEDVIAATTSVSDIDGKLGRLFYVGYDIHDLAPNVSFEETIFLLHQLHLPNQGEL